MSADTAIQNINVVIVYCGARSLECGRVEFFLMSEGCVWSKMLGLVVACPCCVYCYHALPLAIRVFAFLYTLPHLTLWHPDLTFQ